MGIIQFKAANCKNCYKCIRHCGVKSITFHSDQARILEDECVLCGKCTLVCPQNAKQIESDLPKVKDMLARGEKVFVSLAPSYVAAFPNVSFSAMSAALKKLGFSHVEETAIGATHVSKSYSQIAKAGLMPNLITTCCPTIVMLVEKYFPPLLPQLIPVNSPAVTHAKLMRSVRKEDIRVVFIGPCISKKQEARASGEIDAVLMYEELREWLTKEEISLQLHDDRPSEMHQVLSRLYPVPGGILKTIPLEYRDKYKAVAVDGLDRCIEILQSIQKHRITGYLLEMSACENSCVGGPGLHETGEPFLLAKSDIYQVSKEAPLTPAPLSETSRVNMDASFSPTLVRAGMPAEEDIKAILAQIGKTRPEHMLNCGACGYESCREKAIAVYHGKANLKMCLPYMREKAESMSNIILDNTPNALFMLDEDLTLMQYNKAGERMLNLDNTCLGLPLDMFLNMSALVHGTQTGQAVMNVRCKTRIFDLTVEQSLVPVPNGGYLVVARDVTKEEENLDRIEAMRRETLQTAQQVIDKQMRVAQEIASLLGETTGETKAALLKLKSSITKDGKS